MRCYRNLLNTRWHQKVTNKSIRQHKTYWTIIKTIRHIKKTDTVWASAACRTGQSTTKECAIWLYGRSTMTRKTAKVVVGQHHWVDWSECRRCCEDDTRSWSLEKLRIWPQRSMTMRHNDDDDDDDDDYDDDKSSVLFYIDVSLSEVILRNLLYYLTTSLIFLSDGYFVK